MSVNRLQYIRRRILLAVPVVLFIVVLNFLLIQLAPGDAADVLAGEAGSATPGVHGAVAAKVWFGPADLRSALELHEQCGHVRSWLFL